jgi:predicted nucleic acid-binding protein
MNFILDASITLAWCFEDEKTVNTTKLLDSLVDATAYVPAIWSLEVGNILVGAIKRKRISYAAVIQFLEQLNNLNIHIDNETASKGFHDILGLAYSEGLTTYDASYLELAMRKGLALASKDVQLCTVASRLGIPIIKP